MDYGPFARIALRYLGGALVAHGIMTDPNSLLDPDVVQVACILIGAGCSIASEGWYGLARKNGWGR